MVMEPQVSRKRKLKGKVQEITSGSRKRKLKEIVEETTGSGKGQLLSNEVVEEIMLRLPQQSVTRFKSLSCYWLRRLSTPYFTNRYHTHHNSTLLGFYFNKCDHRLKFAAVSSSYSANSNTKARSISYTPKFEPGDAILTTFSSCNGLLLHYSSRTNVRDSEYIPRYRVHDPLTSRYVWLPEPPPVINTINSRTKRFLVVGFACNSNQGKPPDFTVVEVTDSGLPDNSLMVNKYYSLGQRWISMFSTELNSVLGHEYVLTGHSTYYNNSLHWLLEPSGVVAYNIKSDKFSCSLTSVPGDSAFLDESGGCICITQAGKNTPLSSGTCCCRYLGVFRGQLTYSRVTGENEFTVWILENYHRGVWSNPRRVVLDAVDGFSANLYRGRVLAFDRTEDDVDVVYISADRKIWSYNYVTRKLHEVLDIKRDYGRVDAIIPYELPRVRPRIVANRVSISRTTARRPPYLRSPSHLVCCYQHSGVTELARSCFPYPMWPINSFWATIKFRALDGKLDGGASIMDAKLRCSNYLRVEASLYGRVGSRSRHNKFPSYYVINFNQRFENF